MTDRQPDDLYDALHDRLADYGQEPPAPLWANIRAQLPPLVAVPQRRRRRRAVWLGTLLVLLSAGMLGWWWQAGRGSLRPGEGLAGRAVSVPPASQPSTAGSVAGDVAKARISSPQPGAVGNPGAAAGAAGAAVGSLSAAKPVAPEVGVIVPLPDNSSAASLASSAAVSMANAGSRQAGTRPTGAGQLLAAGRAGRSRETHSAQIRAGGESTSGKGRIAVAPSRALAIETKTVPLPSGKSITIQSLQPDADAITTRVATDTDGSQVASQASTTPTIAVARPAATRAASSLKTRPTADTRGATSVAHTTRTLPNSQVLAVGSQPAEIQTGTDEENTPGAALAARAAWRPTGLRTAALALAPAPAPGPLARADTLPRLPLAAVRRWAVQALAGPALTSRSLGFSQLSYAPIPSNSNQFPAYNSTRGVLNIGSPENEQAATGFGAEVQLQRQLNGRWSLGTGLGYHAFATNQTVNVRVTYSSTVATSIRPDSVGTLSVRDTYHFLTLPLRVGYQLGTGPARLRYGLRAGTDVAFYLGGRSTEGSNTTSIGRSWGASGSPYRPLSLALSLGAEVRYQLAPGWELVAQPTLTHFVTSLARPSSGYVVRYPLAASALVGVAWWLR